VWLAIRNSDEDPHVARGSTLAVKRGMRSRFVCLIAVMGCGTDTTEPTPDPDPVPAVTTWYQDVGPIVASRCMGCHREGGIGPFSFETYEDAAVYGMQMLAAVEAGEMPPWSATTASDCAPTRAWKHDPRLTADELDTLRAWIDDGRPAGDVATLTPGSDQTLSGVTHPLAPSESFVTAGTTDQFMCFVLDPQIASEMYLTGWDVSPGNPAVVHHVIIMSLGADVLNAAKNAEVVGKPLPCSVIPMTTAIGAWAPGQGPVEMPDGVAAKLDAGTGVLMQIHYHPAGNVNAPDATAVNLRLTQTPPTKLYAFGGFGNAGAAPALQPGEDDTDGIPEFRIPASKAAHVETMRFTIPKDTPRIPMFIMQPHQHYVGTRLELRIHRADDHPTTEPTDECLVNSDWNFDWQRTYQYDVPLDQLPTFGAGDEIEVKCTYDNTIANPFVQRALADAGLGQPVDVVLGEQTLNEMCLGLVGLVADVPSPPAEAIVPASLKPPAGPQLVITPAGITVVQP
jgi:hypothetical protein